MGLTDEAILKQASLWFPRAGNSLLPVGCSAHAAHNALEHRDAMGRKRCEAAGTDGTPGTALGSATPPQPHCLLSALGTLVLAGDLQL